MLVLLYVVAQLNERGLNVLLRMAQVLSFLFLLHTKQHEDEIKII